MTHLNAEFTRKIAGKVARFETTGMKKNIGRKGGVPPLKKEKNNKK